MGDEEPFSLHLEQCYWIPQESACIGRVGCFFFECLILSRELWISAFDSLGFYYSKLFTPERVLAMWLGGLWERGGWEMVGRLGVGEGAFEEEGDYVASSFIAGG